MDIGALIFGWLIFSVAAGYWNQTRGHSFSTGFLLSILLSPVVGFIIVAATKRKRAKKRR